MRIHVLIHASFETAGVIETWAKNKGHQIAYTYSFRGEQLPDVSELDFLVIMGGPQTCTKLDQYPYLVEEVALTKKVVSQNKPVLGICLGAQILGESFGAKTERSPNKEVGVYPVQLTKEGEIDPLFISFPISFDAMHWHNDMPGIPEGAELLAYSEGCPRQIIKYSKKAYGLQCHMELTAGLIKAMLDHCSDDLTLGKYIQHKEKLLSLDMTEINNKLFIVLDHLTAI